jgi:hypothetical protein
MTQQDDRALQPARLARQVLAPRRNDSRQTVTLTGPQEDQKRTQHWPAHKRRLTLADAVCPGHGQESWRRLRPGHDPDAQLLKGVREPICAHRKIGTGSC